ncbi:collagen alpha-1(IV) chain-like [Aphis craccivora]|uniref:Collagen alpha-1(IV) chain-like n=1 Tax=Aphis craccivora TaxID=307492 RepID=A0A6G0ZHD5_APHCR|nr:collagen alpha-1(IV) chain-like [Aphis craccivora]
MAIVLSAKSKVITGGAVGVVFLLSGLMFCNLSGWNVPAEDGGRLVAGGVTNGRSDDILKKNNNNWPPTSLHLYQKVTCF